MEGGRCKVMLVCGSDRRGRYQPTYLKSYVPRLEETLLSEKEKGKDQGKSRGQRPREAKSVFA